MARREFANLPTTPRETGTVVVKTTGGALADISLTVDGDAIAGSTLDVTADGIIPTFYGPPDGADSVVVTMRQHGLDWDAAVFASDSPPAVSGGSLPVPATGDALKVVAVSDDENGYQLRQSPIGNKADYYNSSPSIVVADGGTHFVTAAELPELMLVPDPSQLPVIETDGSFVFPDGALLLVYAFVTATYAVAPPNGDPPLNVFIANGVEILADVANTSTEAADGAKTSFTAQRSSLRAVPPGETIGPMYVTNTGGGDATVTWVELVIRRAA